MYSNLDTTACLLGDASAANDGCCFIGYCVLKYPWPTHETNFVKNLRPRLQMRDIYGMPMSFDLFDRSSVCRQWNLLSHSLRGSTWRPTGAYRIESDTLVLEKLIILRTFIMNSVYPLPWMSRTTPQFGTVQHTNFHKSLANALFFIIVVINPGRSPSLYHSINSIIIISDV